MLQLVADQQLDQEVSTVEPFFAEVFEFLSLGTVTVREISMEKMGGVAGKNAAVPFDVSNIGFANLRLLFPSSKADVFFRRRPLSHPRRSQAPVLQSSK